MYTSSSKRNDVTYRHVSPEHIEWYFFLTQYIYMLLQLIITLIIIAYTYLYCNGLSDAYEYSYDEVYLGCGSDGGVMAMMGVIMTIRMVVMMRRSINCGYDDGERCDNGDDNLRW